MSPVPGWYPDPAHSGRLRLWDGGDWTTQTSEPTVFTGAASGFSSGQTSVMQRAPFALPPGRPPSRSGFPRWLIAVAAVVGCAVLAGIIWSVSVHVSVSSSADPQPQSPATTTGPGCPNPIPEGASPAAAGYLQALDAARPNWSAISTKLYAENRHPHLSDMAPQVAADGIFLDALQRISFPAEAKSTANQLMYYVSAYRSLLLSDEDDFSLFDQQTAQRQQITDARSAASSRLRALLGLPQATCGYWRP
jgi:hypothetical protein